MLHSPIQYRSIYMHAASSQLCLYFISNKFYIKHHVVIIIVFFIIWFLHSVVTLLNTCYSLP